MLQFLTVIWWLLVVMQSPSCECIENISMQTEKNWDMVWTSKLIWYKTGPYLPKKDYKEIKVLEALVLCQ
jgi:hypothetical protein